MRISSRKLNTVVWRTFILRRQWIVKSMLMIRNNRTSPRDVWVCGFPWYSFSWFRGWTRHMLNIGLALRMLTPQLLAKSLRGLSRMLGYLGEIWKISAIISVHTTVFILLFQKWQRIVSRRVLAFFTLAVRRNYFPQKVEAQGEVWKRADCHGDVIISRIHSDCIFFQVLIVKLIVWLWLRTPKGKIQITWL